MLIQEKEGFTRLDRGVDQIFLPSNGFDHEDLEAIWSEVALDVTSLQEVTDSILNNNLPFKLVQEAFKAWYNKNKNLIRGEYREIESENDLNKLLIEWGLIPRQSYNGIACKKGTVSREIVDREFMIRRALRDSNKERSLNNLGLIFFDVINTRSYKAASREWKDNYFIPRFKDFNSKEDYKNGFFSTILGAQNSKGVCIAY